MIAALCLVVGTARPAAPGPAIARVQAWLAAADATMLPAAACAPGITFRGDLTGSSLKGASAYGAAAAEWRATCEELLGPGYETSVTRVARLSDNEVSVRWRAAWPPDKTRWLENLARLLRWRVERFDLEPTRESAFSFAAVARVFATAASTGVLRLPTACLEAQAVLTLDETTGLCVSHRERLDALGLARASRLRNRRVAADLAEFLDLRRPPAVDSDDWAAEVAASALAGVPGAGVLDIEPLADERESTIALAAFALVVVGAVSFTVASVGGGSEGFGETLCDELGATSAGYSQCVSDLFGG